MYDEADYPTTRPPTEPAATPAAPAGPGQSNVFCIHCGYDLSGATVGSTCSECGAPVADTFRAGLSNAGRTSTWAVVSMILGICSLVICAITGPIAIGLYFPARNDIRHRGYGGSSKGFALAGLITGILGTLLFVVTIVIDGAMFAFDAF